MSVVQLSFALRTSTKVRTVHLQGSWDNYAAPLPLSSSKKSPGIGAWRGTFRFQPSLVQPGQRYWYFYIIDGYHVAHDPAQASTTEPTTRRVLNILDVPDDGYPRFVPSYLAKHLALDGGKRSNFYAASDKSSLLVSRKSSLRDSLGLTVEIPRGRPLSLSKIQSPKPITPHATKFILESDYSKITTAELTSTFSALTTENDYFTRFNSSPSSISSSLSGRSHSDSPSSASSISDYGSSGSVSSHCSCERFGVTRGGNRVRLDCGGSKCGYIDDSSSCFSSDDDDDDYAKPYRKQQRRRARK